MNSSSFTIAMLNVLRDAALAMFSVSLIGIIAGPGPSVPAMVVARSCDTVPMTSPVLAIFIELSRLGSTACT